MNNEQYMTHLYDRAARRMGYDTHAAFEADLNEAVRDRREKEKAALRMDLEAWMKVKK